MCQRNSSTVWEIRLTAFFARVRLINTFLSASKERSCLEGNARLSILVSCFKIFLSCCFYGENVVDEVCLCNMQPAGLGVFQGGVSIS